MWWDHSTVFSTNLQLIFNSCWKKWVTLPLSDAFAFVADRNVFIDAYLVCDAENGCKAKSWFSTTICCGNVTASHHNIWWYFYPLKSFCFHRAWKIPGFRTGDLRFYMWCSSACANMGQQSCTTWRLFHLFTHKNAPSHGNVRALYHEREYSSIEKNGVFKENVNILLSFISGAWLLERMEYS